MVRQNISPPHHYPPVPNFHKRGSVHEVGLAATGTCLLCRTNLGGHDELYKRLVLLQHLLVFAVDA